MAAKPIKAIGLMSGTSLDGLDICLAEFSFDNEKWSYKLLVAETMPYSKGWQGQLSFKPTLPAMELIHLDHHYGRLLGEAVLSFLQKNKIDTSTIDLIASHGHTLYHQPQLGFTYQVGNGPELHAATGLPVVCDFRRQDVALGGQGAPLVPIGDSLLFNSYDACLNLGGFSNISFEQNGNRKAFDICAVNFVINALAAELGYEYDYQGHLAAQGQVNLPLLNTLNSLDYYQAPLPKSLGAEWAMAHLMPLLNQSGCGTIDQIATYTTHAARQISGVLNEYNLQKCLVSGGGAYNQHLIRLIKEDTKCQVQLAEPSLIDYKEALIFAFMGVLRHVGMPNVLSSVTGARYNHSTGVLYK